MKRYCFFLALIIVVIAYGCKQRVVTQPETQQPEKQQTRPQQEISQPQKVTERIPEIKVASIESKDVTTQLEEKRGMFEDILFDYDKYNVKNTYKPIMQSVSSWMGKNPEAKLSIEGHCDERGTNEYNLALGDRRAKAVKDYLFSLGVPASKIDTISYGEEKSLCTEKSEACWAKNRRAHFVILKKAGK